MTAAATKPTEAKANNETAGPRRISEIPGAALGIESCRWREDQRASNLHLVLLLGALTGRLEPSAGLSYSERGRPEDWLTLAQVGEPAIEAVLSRIRRQYPEHRLDGGEATSTLDMLDCHFATAMERKRRER